MRAAAPPTSRSSSASGSHSACQAPVARSAPGPSSAQGGDPSRHPGWRRRPSHGGGRLRLWGRVEDPPRPSSAVRSPRSPRESVWARRVTSRAILPGRRPSPERPAARRPDPVGVQWQGRLGQPHPPPHRPWPPRTRRSRARPERPAAPPSGRPAVPGGRRPGRRPPRPGRPASRPPSARRWSAAPTGPGSGGHDRLPCRSARRAAASPLRPGSGPGKGRSDQRAAVSMMSWLVAP